MPMEQVVRPLSVAFYHVHLYDIDTQQERQLAAFSNQYRARLSGNRLIFEDSAAVLRDFTCLTPRGERRLGPVPLTLTLSQRERG
jgi:hypothetical protein